MSHLRTQKPNQLLDEHNLVGWIAALKKNEPDSVSDSEKRGQRRLSFLLKNAIDDDDDDGDDGHTAIHKATAIVIVGGRRGGGDISFREEILKKSMMIAAAQLWRPAGGGERQSEELRLIWNSSPLSRGL